MSNALGLLTRRSAPVLVTLLSALGWGPLARAKPVHYQVSPEEYQPYKKPIGVFSDSKLSYSMGSYGTSLPILLPPARNGLVPQLSLDYNSNAGHSTLGPGWDLPLDHVRRSVRHGTPRYIGPSGVPTQDDELEFRLEGDSGTLVYCGVENNLRLYRPKLEGAFAKFYYQASGDLWIVQNTSGRTWYLGETGAKDGSGSQTFAWYVRRVVDQYQNMIRYTYGAEHGNLYLERVDYDLKETSDPPNHPYVTLNYDVPTDPPASISYRKGFRAELDGRSLISIQVHAFSETGAPGVRTYNIRQGAFHSCGPHAA